MKLYAARHGQTQWNVLHKVCGRTDINLITEGYRQAEALASMASTHNIQIVCMGYWMKFKKRSRQESFTGFPWRNLPGHPVIF
ncbi:histidine phosphatase family protein [Blautia producta]|uniref:histidine phosphatase family protein n=1 Tax=Blautia producta TaxID=33035 RepID=UPI0031B5CD54